MEQFIEEIVKPAAHFFMLLVGVSLVALSWDVHVSALSFIVFCAGGICLFLSQGK